MYHKPHRRTIYYLPRRNVSKTKGLLLSKAIEGFMLACNARQLSSHTIRDYRLTLSKFLKHTGDMPIHQIGTGQVTAFLSVQKVGKKTLLNYHIGLSALWTWAFKEEFVDKHIPRLVDRPKPKKVVVEPFTQVEVRAIMSAIRYAPDRNRALILVLLDTGARASEVCALNRSDVDLSNRRIHVIGKGDKERNIRFSPRTASALFSHLAVMKGDMVFPFTRTSLAQYLRRLGKRAGVENVHAHRFRHTMAIQYLRNRGNPYVLQEILGHSTMEMVRRYIAISQVDLDQSHDISSPVQNWGL